MNDLIAVQKIAGWEKLKTLVLDSVSSPITKRVYNMALDEFIAWFQQAAAHVVAQVAGRFRLAKPTRDKYVIHLGTAHRPAMGRPAAVRDQSRRGAAVAF